MKDPVLLSYSVEELMYEYMSLSAFETAKEDKIEQDHDKIEQENWDAAEAWADEMEAEDSGKPKEFSEEDKTWMDEQIRLDREEFGDDFGNDVNLNFDEE